MPREITLDTIDHLAAGSAFLGTGGGGDPYLGSLLCRQALERHGPVPLIALDELEDEAAVFVAAAIGAPTVMIEKLYSVEDQHRAITALEKHVGRTATAIISAEIGGCNSMMPVAYAAKRGLPLVDGDGMGRAFPALQMTSFNICGIDCAPLTLADEHGNSVLVEAKSGLRAEELARPVTAAMGASACMSCYPMTGAQARHGAVPQSISAAIAIGQAIASGKGAPVERLLTALNAHRYYAPAETLFEGKVTALESETRGGWVFGTCTIAALRGRTQATLTMQNEMLSLRIDGELRCVVPDLLTVVDAETAHAIPVERLAYGQRVAVIACNAPPQLTTADALAIVGPAAFGIDEAYQPFAGMKP